MDIIIQYHARYSDGYSYKVVYDPTDKKTYLATEDGGRMPVLYHVNGATFVEFYFTGGSGISTAYAFTLRNQMDQLLSRPARSAAPAALPVEDSRLHIEPKLGTESSFLQLQRANATRINEERRNREAARAEAQQVNVDPAKVAAARQINNEYAALRNRHGIKKD